MDLTVTLDSNEWRIITSCLRVVRDHHVITRSEIDEVAEKIKEQFEPQVRPNPISDKIRRIK